MNKSINKRNFALCLFFLGSVTLTHCKVNSSDVENNAAPIRILMVGGGSSHDFDHWFKGVDAQTLREEGLAAVKYTSNTDSIAHYLPQVDVLYLANNQPINEPATRRAIFDFVANGKGLVLGHAALWYNWSDWPEYNRELVSGGSRGHDRYGSFEVTIAEGKHPITENVPASFTLKDELYYFKTDPSGPGITVLAWASAGQSETRYPSVFVVNRSGARIAGLALGHDGASHNLPAYKTLLRNAVKWASQQK